eukprot:TRINITY_DN3113_c0_g1_i1.p1 TRINITY_DN3113_c0_g1~~TRINITY_DN3113_c0_g1_i1.p1  ORF type:complete len:1297 (+),score=465.44 TRINITY_DN3113_c0_g1_i1:193-4083(+)
MANTRKALKATFKKPKLEWLDRRRMRVVFLCFYVLLSIAIFLSVALVIFLSNRDLKFEGFDLNQPMNLVFERSADMELRFQYKHDIDNDMEIRFHRHVPGVCTADLGPTPNSMVFGMTTPKSKIVNPKAEDYPCWATVYLRSPSVVMPPFIIQGNTHRRVNVRTVDEPLCNDGDKSCFKTSKKEMNRRVLDNNGNELHRPFRFNGDLFINGTVFSVAMNNTQANSVTATSLVGDIVFDNLTLSAPSTFASTTGAVFVRSTNDLFVTYSHPKEYLCMEGPVDPVPGPCVSYSSCPPEEFNCTINCVSSTVNVFKSGFPDTTLVPITMSSELGTLYATTYYAGTDLRKYLFPGRYQGTTGAKAVDFVPEHKAELENALHNDIEYDMFRVRIDSPGSPRGGLTTQGGVPTLVRYLWLWGRRDIFLRIHPPILDMASGGLLNPVTYVQQADLGPSFCPAFVPKDNPVDYEEQRMAYLWRLLKTTTTPDEGTRIAIREGCKGNSVFVEDPVTGSVSREAISWTTHSLTIAVGVTSFVLSLSIGIAVGIIVKIVYISQTKKKRQEILLRFRSLKSQGYFSLGGGYYLYHSPPDQHRWKRDFYVSDPFGRISALRSMKDYRGFGDIFRALNSQRYQTVKIQLEDEAQVRRARKRRRDAEISAAEEMSVWYRENFVRRTLIKHAKNLMEQAKLKAQREHELKNIVSTAQHVEGDQGDESEEDITAEEMEMKMLDAIAKERQKKRDDEKKEMERREAQEKKEQSKIEARTKKQEQAEEELLVRFFVGPFLFMEIFLETLFLTFWPGLQRRRDFDSEAIQSIKRLVTVNTRSNFLNALTLALRISSADMRQKAIDHIKSYGRDQSDVLNAILRKYQSKQSWAWVRWIKKVLGEERAVQFFVVTSHVICQLLPPIVLILFGFILATKWGESPITANCSVFVFRSVYSFFVGFIFYFIAFAKLVYFYMEINNGHRWRLRKAYHIYSIFTIVCSVTLLMIFAFWVMLGLLLKPEIAAPPATAIATMGIFVITQYRAVMDVRDNLKKALESYMNEKFKKKLQHLENKEDILDRVIVQLGLSVRNIIVMLFGAAVFLGLVFLFIFLGIAVFEGKGAASAIIQSVLAVLSGVGVSFMKGREAGDMKDKLKVKVPTMLKELINSVLQRGLDMIPDKKASTGGGRSVTQAKGNEDLDIDVTSSLYGAMQVVQDSETVQKARDLDFLQVGLSTAGHYAEEEDGSLPRFWKKGDAEEAGGDITPGSETGSASSRSLQNSTSTRSLQYQRIDDKDPTPPALIQDKPSGGAGGSGLKK